MKIGIDARRLNPGRGMDRHTEEIIKHLSKIDKVNQYRLFTNNDVSQYELGSNFIREKLHKRFHFIRKSHMEWYGKLFFKDLDIFHFPTADIWNSSYCKTLVTLHDITPYKYPEKFFSSDEEYFTYQKHIELIKRNASCIITVSNYSKNDIIDTLGIKKNRIRVAYSGVDNNIFYKSEISVEDQSLIFDKYNIRTPYILNVGGIDFRKNLKNMIAAFILLKKNYKIPHKLIIVGSVGKYNHEYKLELIKIIQAENIESDIIFTGYVDDNDLRTLYNYAELFVFPSLYEGFGMPPVESMACGCPVITSNNTSLKEICSDSAVLIDPLDVNHIADGMHSLMNDKKLRSHLIKNGYATAIKYSWDNSVQKLLNIYNQC